MFVTVPQLNMVVYCFSKAPENLYSSGLKYTETIVFVKEKLTVWESFIELNNFQH